MSCRFAATASAVANDPFVTPGLVETYWIKRWRPEWRSTPGLGHPWCLAASEQARRCARSTGWVVRWRVGHAGGVHARVRDGLRCGGEQVPFMGESVVYAKLA